MFSKEAIKLAKPCYEAIKKISKGKWEWKPEVGEQFIGVHGMPIVIAGIIDVPLIFGTENRRLQYLSMDKVREIFVKDVIPLLHWERIEEILEGMGYGLLLKREDIGGKHYQAEFWNKNTWGHKLSVGKTRQEAVMRAVIEVGKEE